MFKGYRNGAFALGLVVGGGITLNLFLWLDYLANRKANKPTQTDNQTAHSQIGGYWDWFLRTFVDPNDTLAQWIMAVFTVAVVYLVWKTLITTQAMAQETQRIGEAQVRAYVEVADVKFFWGDPRGQSPRFTIILNNHGNTPAKWFQIRQGFKVFDRSDESTFPQSFSELSLPSEFGPVWNGVNSSPDGMGTAGPVIHSPAKVKGCWRDRISKNSVPPDNDHGVIVFGEVKYCTIFDEVYVSQFFFGAGSLDAYEAESITESDGVTVRVEKPRYLTRIPIKLDLYKAQQKA